MENEEKQQDEETPKNTYVPYPGADEKYRNDRDWRLYDKDKYHDPDWSPEKE